MRFFVLFLLVNAFTCAMVIAQQTVNSDSPFRAAGNSTNYSPEQPDEPEQPWNDGLEQQTGAIGFSNLFEGMGSVTVQGSADPNAPRMSVGHSYGGGGRWLRSLDSRVESDDFQTLFSVGGTVALFQFEQRVVAARAMGGYAMRHRDVNDDSYHYTVDLYGAAPIMDGKHWVKGGWFVDRQDEFGKTGPEVGLLMFADRCNPLTVDLAYGFGTDDEAISGIELVEAPDDDLQLRVGTIVGNRLHVGATLQYLNYDAFGVVDANEVWECS